MATLNILIYRHQFPIPMTEENNPGEYPNGNPPPNPDDDSYKKFVEDALRKEREEAERAKNDKPVYTARKDEYIFYDQFKKPDIKKTTPSSPPPSFSSKPVSPSLPPTPPTQPKRSVVSTPLPEPEPDGMFKISRADFDKLVKFHTNFETQNRVLIFLLGVFFGAGTLAGALIGYVRSYNRFFRAKRLMPNLYPLKPINRVAMAIGIALVWLLTGVMYTLTYYVFNYFGFNSGAIIAALFANIVTSAIVYGFFKSWQNGINNKLIEDEKFGTARFAREDELLPLKTGKGYYIGHRLHYFDRGHLLTVAGTRGGKGTNIIIPNLLGAGQLETSWVVIDPKGENAAITGRYQRTTGKNVVVLNPWGLLEPLVGQAQSYNPLDMLSDKSSPHLVDDVQMLAEMIVPVEAGNKDPFWSDTARTVISGLLLHLVTSQPKQNCHLGTLWKWVRLFGEDWDKLIQDMGINDDPVNGDIVQNAANEILKLSSAGEETFGSIISGVLQATDFLKSPLLQKSLESGFDPKVLADGNTVLYVIIPADKLRAYSRWLRLVVTSMMRTVIRKPDKRVTFLLDEFAALGYLPEIETALSTYAGYNVTVWPILQSLIQLQALYGNNWQSFIANCNVRQYFSINDNESADYISAAIGQTSHTITTGGWLGIKSAEATARLLITPDELRRESGKKIFMFVGDLPPTYVDKLPYHLNPEWIPRADKNPYFN